MNLLTTNKECCQGILYTLYKKLTRSIKVFLMLFLITGVFIQSSQGQNAGPTLPTCNGMTTPGFISCANDVIIYTSNVDQATTGTYTISPNTSGAFFTANGLTSITLSLTPGFNTVAINVGPNPGNFTTMLRFGSPATDVGSCSASRVVRLIGANSTHTDPLCFGETGKIDAHGIDGVTPYSYTIAGPTVNTTGASTGVFTGLIPGNYTITVRDATQNGGTGCAATTSQTIGGPQAALSAKATGTNVNCFGGATGSATVSVLGGTPAYTYSWNSTPVQTTATASNLPAGTYTVTVTDSKGCTTTASYTVTQPASALTATSVFGNVNCTSTSSGTVTVTAAGATPPYSYVVAGPTVNTTGATSGAFTGLTAGSYTVTVTDKNGCATTTTSVVGNLPCVVCSYTQGFWGNKNGLALLSKSGGILSTSITIGTGTKTVFIPAGSASKLNSVMPGGSTAGPLTFVGSCDITTPCFSSNYLTGQGRINNVLLSQTITLSLNVRLGNTLNNVPIQSGCLLTSGGSYPIDQSVATYLSCKGTATVSGLLGLANAVLGGALTPGANSGGCIVPSYSAINSAVDAINNAFDECKNYNGYGVCTTSLKISNPEVTEEVLPSSLKVNVAPNPYHDYITFNIESNISGQGVLEVYNLLGQKVKTVFEGKMNAGKGQNIRFSIPEQNRANLIYRLRVGDKTTTGKVLYMN